MIFKGKDLNNVAYEDIVLYEKVGTNYNEETNSIEVPEEFNNLSVRNLFLRDPAEFFKRYFVSLKSEIRILIFDFQVYMLFIFILMSLAYLFKKRKYKQKTVILFIFPLFHIESRYLTQILTFISFIMLFFAR